MYARLPMVIVVASLALGFPERGSRAATVDRLSFDDLLAQSGLIIEAEVLHVDPDAQAGAGSARSAPSTRVELRVLDVVSGGKAAAATLRLTLPEGRLPDGRFVMLAGAPRLAPGQRYLMLLRAGPWYHTPFVGWDQGLLRRVEVDGVPRFVAADGRCVAGVDRRGWAWGPRIAGPSPVAPGWIGVGSEGARGALDTTRGGCMTSKALRRALVGRMRELSLRSSGRIETRPRAGGWVEAELAP